MKNNDVQINATYLVKVAGNLVPVRIDREHESGGWVGTSLKTGKQIRIKSPQRLRKRIDDTAPVATKAKRAAKDATNAPERDTGERDATGGEREASNRKPMSLLDAAAQRSFLPDPRYCATIAVVYPVSPTKNVWHMKLDMPPPMAALMCIDPTRERNHLSTNVMKVWQALEITMGSAIMSISRTPPRAPRSA